MPEYRESANPPHCKCGAISTVGAAPTSGTKSLLVGTVINKPARLLLLDKKHPVGNSAVRIGAYGLSELSHVPCVQGVFKCVKAHFVCIIGGIGRRAGLRCL